MKTNYHTHIYLCRHATGTIEDYVKKAIDRHYQIIGISDHGPVCKEISQDFKSSRMSFDEYENEYLPVLEKVKVLYQSKIKVLGAVEIEYYDDMTKLYAYYLKKLDYLVLGQHLIKKENHFLSIYAKHFTKEDVENYVSTIERALNTGFFKILAHPDLIMWAYPTWDETMERATRRIVEAARTNNVYLEFNANGLRRQRFLQSDGSYNFIYPKLEFWEIVKKEYDYDKIVINDDCHALKDFDDAYTEEARTICKKLNLKISDKIEF